MWIILQWLKRMIALPWTILPTFGGGIIAEGRMTRKFGAFPDQFGAISQKLHGHVISIYKEHMGRDLLYTRGNDNLGFARKCKKSISVQTLASLVHGDLLQRGDFVEADRIKRIQIQLDGNIDPPQGGTMGKRFRTHSFEGRWEL